MSDRLLDRSQVPAPAAIRSFDFPAVEASSLSNGMGVRMARMPRLPVVSVHLLMSAGESALGHERAGLAALTGDALEGGTEERSGTDLAEALEGIGATLTVGTGWDATTVSLSCLADRLEEALALLAEVVLQPSFPEEEVERARDQRLARIRQRAMDPSSLAADHAARLFYEEGCVYGRPLVGTLDSLGRVDREAVHGFAKAFHLPGGSALVLVGDLGRADVMAMAERRFGDWVGEGPERREVEGLPRTRERTVHVVNRPGSVQSELRIGHPGVPRKIPDYFPLVVANTVFGGSFTSRLNLNLREQHGFTYGVRSRFAFRRGPGPFTISTAVGRETTADAVREAMGELRRFVEAGPTEGETDAVRDYLAGVFPLRLETTGQVASQIAESILYDLPDDWHANYRDRVRGVSREDAAEAVAQRARPDEVQIVVVGDAEEIGGPLGDLGLGPLHVNEGAEG